MRSDAPKDMNDGTHSEDVHGNLNDTCYIARQALQTRNAIIYYIVALGYPTSNISLRKSANLRRCIQLHRF